MELIFLTWLYFDLNVSRYLAKDEMETITNDKWGEEVWGAATDPGTTSGDTINSNLVFFWGKHVSRGISSTTGQFGLKMV